ncbi:MAG: hypothetical protein ACE5IY_14420 [bacterium]
MKRKKFEHLIAGSQRAAVRVKSGWHKHVICVKYLFHFGNVSAILGFCETANVKQPSRNLGEHLLAIISPALTPRFTFTSAVSRLTSSRDKPE